eukprot:COSAG06_NODE_20844_length_779_cov_0.963235_1_plen_210_part_01
MEHRCQHRLAAKGASYWKIAALLFCGILNFGLSTHPSASPAMVEGLVVLDGQVRVQAVSSKLLRIEPLGPRGFEDNTTFMVSERFIDESAPALSILNQTNQIVWVSVAGTGSTPSRLVSIALERRSGSVSEDDVRVSTSVYDQQHNGEVTAQWSSADLATVDAQLWWPDPLSTTSYAIQDFPRFTPPPWGPTLPPTRDIDEPLRDTSGYD